MSTRRRPLPGAWILGALAALALGTPGCLADRVCIANCEPVETSASGSGGGASTGSSGTTTTGGTGGAEDTTSSGTAGGTAGTGGTGGAGGGTTGAGGAGGETTGAGATGGAGGGTTGTTTGAGGGCEQTNGGVEACDGKDNDCNGAIDDDPAIDFTAPKTCGTCANDCYALLFNCAVAAIQCLPSANPGTDPGTCMCTACDADYYTLDAAKPCGYYCVKSAGSDAVCDGKDDDCDGLVDEDVDVCTSTAACGKCGNGCITLNGTPKCAHVGPLPCTPADTQCQIDTCTCSAPGNCFWDLDKSYATGCEYACDVTNGGVEICDGKDNDCDGKTDGADDLSSDSAIGVVCYGDPDGVCATAARAGTTECQGGGVVCVGPNLLVQDQAAETCNGLDDDCDGVVDEAPMDAGKPCGLSNVAPCSFGATQCVLGALVCVGRVEPQTETCNGVDDDCDGVVDNGATGAGAACGQSNVGACKKGTLQCAGGSFQCVGAVNPVTETCNGEDDDCDGSVDDDIAGVGSQCGQSNTSPCAFGTTQCQNGQMTCVGAVDPQTETCNNVDDDCDGVVDDSTPGSGASCGQSNVAPCALGTTQCQGGLMVCAGALDPQTETCDGVDNDCDGTVDDGPAGAGAPCGQSGTGACVLGTFQCQGGALSCVGAVNPVAETCNGVDDDCDGVVDDTPAGVGTQCGTNDLGVCVLGTKQCQGGALVCVGAVNPSPELCNNLDDDCDGTVDDNPTDAGSTCGQSNVFPCAFGSIKCQSGALVCVGAVNPKTETCNGVDDNCDGTIDATGGLPPSDAVGACNVPTPPPAGATSPCSAGTLACTNGVTQCVGSAGPTGTLDTCDVDANCDGTLTNQPDKPTDVNNCGSCGTKCYTGNVHGIWGCVSGACQFQGCEAGYYDPNGDNQCEYACVFVSATESCNGIDDNCNGVVDEGVIAPTPTQVCGVSPAVTAAECTSGVTVACQAGAWKCTFPAGVCNPTCAGATETCDTLDNNCNGQLNENVANYNAPCASDDGAPVPGHAACRTTGTFVCNGGSATQCSAVKNLAAAGPELCDGIDNDCDGSVDEAFNAKGTNTTYFVKPAVTKLAGAAAGPWIFTYEASRPSATNVAPGNGNGYWTSAPAGQTIDKTRACSVASKIPWFNVTPLEVEQTCVAAGGTVCTTAVWTTACQATGSCTWAYNPRGAACTSAYTGSKYCNLGPSFDFTSATAGDQDGLLATSSPVLLNCWADWSGLFGNTSSNNKLYDITGNLREITKTASNDYRLMGGAYNTASDQGATCTFSNFTAVQDSKFGDAGFRCCFTSDPTL